MKKFKKLLCVMVALAMALGIFAFAACDDDNTQNSSDSGTAGTDATESSSDASASSSDDDSDGNGNGNSALSTLVLATLSDIYTSETGYEFTLTADYTKTADSVVTGSGLNASVLTQNDGENFNADVTAYLSSAKAQADGTSTYTEYSYISALLRGTDLYTALAETSEEGMTESELADLVYGKTQLDTYIDMLTGSEASTASLTASESGNYDGLLSAISALAANLFTGLEGTAEMKLLSSSSSSNTLDFVITVTFDLSGVLASHVTAVDDVLNVINASAESGTDYTVDDFLADATVQTTIEKYLDGVTADDIYQILSAVDSLASSGYVNLSTLTGITVPETTDGQTAYEYILKFVTDNDYGTTVLNGSKTIAYVAKALEVTGELKTALETATVQFAVTYNSSTYSLSSITFDVHELTVNGCDYDVDVDLEMQSKQVTLTDISEITCRTSAITGNAGKAEIDETRNCYYAYALCDYSDESSVLVVYYTVIEYDTSAESYGYSYETLYYSVSYTKDGGTVTDVTLTDINDADATPSTYAVTDNAFTLPIYDEVAEIVIGLN